MTAPQPGDRVSVAFDATYIGVRGDRAGHIVAFDMPDYPEYRVTVPLDAAIDVLAKPLQVGDTLTIGVDPEPPVGTVLIYEDGEAIRHDESGKWTFASTCRMTFKWSTMSRQKVTVAYIGNAR